LPFGVPNGGLYKYRERMPETLASGEREYLWQFDERGSFNAVCGYLRSLGVRWYLPGEIVPKMKSVPLPRCGIRGGHVIGATTDDGTQVDKRPVTVPDLFCTFCHALKINPRKENVSPLGRPLTITKGGEPVKELL